MINEAQVNMLRERTKTLHLLLPNQEDTNISFEYVVGYVQQCVMRSDHIYTHIYTYVCPCVKV